MAPTTRAYGRGIALGCLFGAALQIAHADVTLEERISVEGAGMMRMANMSGRTVTTISGDRARMESDMQMQSPLARMAARGAGQHIEIVRLDQDKVYSLDPNRRQYTEQSFAEMRAQLERAMSQTQQAGQSMPGPIDDSECEWSEPKADVRRTGERSTIAGFDAEHVAVIASQACKHKTSGSVCEFALSLDQWLTPGVPGGNDALAFQKAYAQKMGFDAAASRDLAARAEGMFSRYEGMWKQLASKLSEVQGYPVRSRFSLAIGGPQCQSASDMASAQNAQGGEGAQGSVGEAASEGAARGALGGGIAGEIGGRIAGSLFRRRQQQQEKEKAAAESAAPAEQPATSQSAGPGMIPFMTVSSELVSVSTKPAPASAFEIPAGFRKAAANE